MNQDLSFLKAMGNMGMKMPGGMKMPKAPSSSFSAAPSRERRDELRKQRQAEGDDDEEMQEPKAKRQRKKRKAPALTGAERKLVQRLRKQTVAVIGWGSVVLSTTGVIEPWIKGDIAWTY